jgi:tetratricopeptide (TPR) repeat protein
MNQKFLYLLHISNKSSTFAAMFAKGRYIGWLLGALCLIGQGCSSGAVQEAEHVVAQADSLRTQGGMYGIDEGDSARLAQAYHTLHRQKAFYPDEYARCCYHYGRLLREEDDPVAAMQVLINATHSRTRDYHILGRIYSNMGDIAHLAGEFDLSYNMYERSGEMYLLAKDTLLYYYDLNNMAYELAEQGKKEESSGLGPDFLETAPYVPSVDIRPV